MEEHRESFELEDMSLRGRAGSGRGVVARPASWTREVRRRGVGRLLLEATLRDLRSAGAPRVVLSDRRENEPAQRLFARLGFRRTMIEMTRELD